MPRPKNPNAKGADAKARYYQKKQPQNLERWTSAQFQKWVDDMGYPPPFDPEPIAEDLGIKTNRVYVYWRGYEKGAAVALPATTTLLCKALLELKRRGKAGK